MPPKTPTTTRPKSPVVVPHPPEVKVRVTLELSSHLFDLYSEQGIAAGRMPEEEMIERLRRCSGFTAAKPLYLNDDQRGQLEKALGHNLNSAEQAIAQVTSAVSLQVGDCGVEISPRIAQRVASRAKAERKTYEEVIQREVIKGLSVYSGLIPG